MNDDTKITAADIATGKHYCHACKRTTEWYSLGRGIQRCNGGCNTRFPCRSKRCGHSDCDAARARGFRGGFVLVDERQ